VTPGGVEEVIGSCRVDKIRRGGLGGAVPDSGGRASWLALVTMAGPRWGIQNKTCSVVALFSETALEEPFTAAKGIY
jgi:hypothetical protein